MSIDKQEILQKAIESAQAIGFCGATIGGFSLGNSIAEIAKGYLTPSITPVLLGTCMVIGGFNAVKLAENLKSIQSDENETQTNKSKLKGLNL